MKKIFQLVCFLGVLASAPGVASGQAFCALRAPKEAIKDLYPESTGYESIIRTVGTHEQAQVQKRSPLTLHFSEFGCHTLYVVRKDRMPIGFVRVQSQESRWGLVEVSWSLDLNLKIREFYLQRCRDPKRKALESGDLIASLRGLGAKQVSDWINPKGQVELPKDADVPPEALELAHSVVESGLKALLVTDIAWASATTRVRMEAAGLAFLPEGADMQFDDAPYGEALPDWARGSAALEARARAERTMEFRNAEGKKLGTVVRSIADHEQRLFSVFWVFDAEGGLLAVNSERGWPDRDAQLAVQAATTEKPSKALDRARALVRS